MLKLKNLTPELKKIYDQMEKTMSVLEKDFTGLRTGRASISLIDSINVDLHGAKTPLYQMSNISVLNNQTLLVKLWDKNIIKKVEKALIDANLGISISSEDNIVSVKIPLLSEERRKELTKIALKYAEKVKIMLRSVRKEYNDVLKSQEKKKEISKDDLFAKSKALQNILDYFIEMVDQALEKKTKDIITL
ncbi:MAG: ribosome recycling factor [Rickettsia sp.]|nr:ribosome recycling factor [Rickettsia sp.]